MPKASAGSSKAWVSAWITRRGDRMYIFASRSTGQTACWPASGSRMIELAKVEAALLGLPGRTTMVGRRKRPAVDEALAAVVVEQQLAGRLLGAVGGLGGEDRAVVQDLRHGAAIDRDRAREHEADRLGQRPAGLEDVAGAIQIDPVAEIEVLLGIGADDRGQMEHAIGARADQAAHRGRIGDVAGGRLEARIVGQAVGLDDIEQGDRPDRLHGAVPVHQRAAGKERARELLADEAGAAGDHDAHCGASLPWGRRRAGRSGDGAGAGRQIWAWRSRVRVR